MEPYFNEKYLRSFHPEGTGHTGCYNPLTAHKHTLLWNEYLPIYILYTKHGVGLCIGTQNGNW